MQTISAAVLRDALGVCGGLCRLNAKTARGYGFTVATNGKVVSTGESLWSNETPQDNSKFDGYISFEEKTLTNLNTGNVKSI